MPDIRDMEHPVEEYVGEDLAIYDFYSDREEERSFRECTAEAWLTLRQNIYNLGESFPKIHRMQEQIALRHPHTGRYAVEHTIPWDRMACYLAYTAMLDRLEAGEILGSHIYGQPQPIKETLERYAPWMAKTGSQYTTGRKFMPHGLAMTIIAAEETGDFWESLNEYKMDEEIKRKHNRDLFNHRKGIELL